MKYYIPILLLSVIYCSAQKVEDVEFTKGYWFVSCCEDNFFKADTLTLMRIVDYKADVEKRVDIVETYPHDYTNFSTLIFEPNGQLSLNYYSYGPRKKCTWRINALAQTLNMDLSGVGKHSYRILSKTSAFEKWSSKFNEENIHYEGNIERIKIVKISPK